MNRVIKFTAFRPSPKFSVGEVLKIHFQKKPDKIAIRVFNYNRWYYAMSKDKYHFYQESYLNKITNLQLNLF